MAEEDRFRQVGEDFKLTNEVLVVVTDAEGEGPSRAVVFWREGNGGAVSEIDPTDVPDALDQAKATAARLGRDVVVQLDDQDVWWSHWGTLS